MIVRLGDIINKVSQNVDRYCTSLQYYIGKGLGECGELAITEKGDLKKDVETLGYQFQFEFHKGDTLFFTKSHHIRKAGYVDFDGICSIATFVLRSKDSNVLLPEYLPIIIHNDSFWDYCIDNESGSVNTFVRWSTLADYEFDLPPIEKQREIVSKAWAAYRVKESYKKLLAATDDMLKAKFMEMFGDLDKNRIVKDVANVVSGKSIPTKYEDIVGNIAYVKVADFNIPGNEKYITTSSRFVTLESASLSKYVSSGSVLFAKNGAAALSNKKRLTIIDCCIDMNTMAIIPMKDKICPEYLLSIFENTNIEDYVRQGAIPSISPKDIENMAIYLPPLPLQQQFVEIATQAEATKESLRKSIENIDQVIKSLINQ